jgi:muramoyltetrapeptide carboxypeptidase
MNLNLQTIPLLDMSNLQKPLALRSGDRVGLFAPSFPTAAWFKERLEFAVKGLEQSLGVEVVTASQVYDSKGFTAGNAQRRALALQELIDDESVRAIFCTLGGFNSAELLPLLNADSIKKNTKIIVGYSDCTALLCGLQAIGGWYTFYGPAVMTQFGEYPHPLDYTLDSIRQVFFEGASDYPVADPAEWTNEFLDWGTEAWRSRPRRMTGTAEREIWKPGKGSGHLFGGNIETLNFMIGTPYIKVPEQLVLFWEATEEEAYLPRIQRALTHLKQTGLLERTRAMLIGRSPDCKPVRDVQLRDVVLEAVAEFEFPIIANLAFGHTDPMLTIPLGAKSSVEAGQDEATIRILDSAVRRVN